MAVTSRVEKNTRVFGVISDTHGLIRPQVTRILSECERIIHAGDVGGQEILDELSSLAPIEAVRGNMDYGGWASSLPQDRVVEVDGRCLYVLHDASSLDLNPAAAGFDVVITGHTHRPALFEREGVLYLNPGSAGPRRHSRPPTLALLKITDEGIEAELIDLDR